MFYRINLVVASIEQYQKNKDSAVLLQNNSEYRVSSLTLKYLWLEPVTITS